jgi:hypothetical protein
VPSRFNEKQKGRDLMEKKKNSEKGKKLNRIVP